MRPLPPTRSTSSHAGRSAASTSITASSSTATSTACRTNSSPSRSRSATPPRPSRSSSRAATWASHPRRRDRGVSTTAEHMPSAHRAHAEWTPLATHWLRGEGRTRDRRTRHPHPRQPPPTRAGYPTLAAHHALGVIRTVFKISGLVKTPLPAGCPTRKCGSHTEPEVRGRGTDEASPRRPGNGSRQDWGQSEPQATAASRHSEYAPPTMTGPPADNGGARCDNRIMRFFNTEGPVRPEARRRSTAPLPGSRTYRLTRALASK